MFRWKKRTIESLFGASVENVSVIWKRNLQRLKLPVIYTYLSIIVEKYLNTLLLIMDSIEENSTNCALTTLKTCKHLTTANLAQEIIELIRKETCVFKGNGAFKPTVSNNFSFVIFTYLLYQQLFY